MANRITNYDGGFSCNPAQVFHPESAENIAEILKDPGRYPGPVRAMGSFHSLTPCVSTEGTVIHMSRMKRIKNINKERMTFTAEAGLHFLDASKALRAENLQFFTNIEIGNMTLGAAACCHTKDGLDGHPLGQMGSYVTGIKWVTPGGMLAEATEEENPELLRLMRSSYGLCGVVYEVTFRIIPLRAVHFEYMPRQIKDLTDEKVRMIIAGAEGLVCWTIGRKAHFQSAKHADEAGRFGAWFAGGRRTLWNHTEARVARLIDNYVPTRTLRTAGHNAWFAGNKALMWYLSVAGGARILDPDKTIDYGGTKPSAKYAFTFWTFPADRWLGTLREYLDFSDRHFQKWGFRCNMPLGSYYIRKDQNAILSYSYDGDTFSIDPIHAVTDQSAWHRFLQEFNDFAYKRNGIPLFNQSPFVTRDQVKAAYGERWTEFSAFVKRSDPGGRMLNPFFNELLL